MSDGMPGDIAESMNGAGAFIRTVIQVPGLGAKLIYTSGKGQFLGQVEYMTTSPVALKMMAQDFGQLVAEATSGIIRAGALPTPPA